MQLLIDHLSVTPTTRTTRARRAPVDDRPILDGVNGCVEGGRLTAWVGPNGAGKTSLMRACLGQGEGLHTSGTVWLEPGGGVTPRRSVRSIPPAERARMIAYVPQKSGAALGFTVAQVIGMGQFAWGADRGRRDHATREAMRRCGIDEALSARVFNTLSGGEQRRVMLARALVQVDEHHGLLLADEPLAGLDPRHAAAAMSVLREVADRGAAVVVILHELEAALRWCDAVWLMDRGVLVATGSAEQVLTPARLESVYGLKVVRGDVAGTPTFVWSPGRPELSRPTAAV